ncbi:helix-turn-helix domain-containing protein [Lihuaxuella thermophila]|uniref:Helix-turn-helix n=1 Tax=Lihuaxuella thermophila TaxID=1173111 RepID=A0A1H8CFQ9_9BACL|nr:tetratricopeptide repeat protein [Lihuaxuella thermophila]SEM93274.1 Helix-turn-helix [Lihuaxuella thermophila]
MNVLEMNEIGKFIRKIRKERGLRLEDLSDEHISTATISNIERGVPHVNKEKVLYLLSKLNIDINEIPELMEKDSENMESLQLKFTAVETMIEIGNEGGALRYLSEILEESPSSHPATVHFLKGKCYAGKKDWRKAEREFGEAIRLSYQDAYSQKTNLEAISYEHLAECRSAQNDWEQALKFAERGLEVFQEGASGYDQVQYSLMMNRVVYLDRLGRVDEAQKSLDELWSFIPHIQNQGVLLRMYALRADLFRRMKLYHDAVRYAREGIRIAAASKNYDGMFRLWNILGIAYMELSDWEDAETCFEFIMNLKDRISNKKEMIQVYCSLGHLYLLQQKWVRAQEILEQAVKWGEELEDDAELSLALFMMGRLLKEKKQYSEAVSYLKRSVYLAEKNKLAERVCAGYYEIAQCHEQSGNRDELRDTTEKLYQSQKQLRLNPGLTSKW